jgi:uncharacterized protein
MTNLASQDVAILFARVPVPGNVKTRLIGPSEASGLTAEQACSLHLACVGDVAELLERALPHAQKWLYWSEAPGPECSVGELGLPPSFGIALQSGSDLGERMARAVERTLSAGAGRVLLVGSDSPTLPPEYLSQAIAALESSDVVIGPSDDGGFYLIGAKSFKREIFDGVAWSSAETYAQTVANVRASGLTLTTLPSWYDVDEWRDLQRMISEAQAGVPLPPRVAAFLAAAGHL